MITALDHEEGDGQEFQRQAAEAAAASRQAAAGG
jgi:hypothetical protein